MSSTRRAHVYACKRPSERILGFFWTDCPLCNLVIVTTRHATRQSSLSPNMVGNASSTVESCSLFSPDAATGSLLDVRQWAQVFLPPSTVSCGGGSGLELFAVSASAKGELVMRLVEARPQLIVWYAYAPDSRVLITATGPRCRSLSGLQVRSSPLGFRVSPSPVARLPLVLGTLYLLPGTLKLSYCIPCTLVYRVPCTLVYLVPCTLVYLVPCTLVYFVPCTFVYFVPCTLVYLVPCTFVYFVPCTLVYFVPCTFVYFVPCTLAYSVPCTFVNFVPCTLVYF